MTLDMVVAAILSLQPALSPKLAMRHAQVILGAANEENEAAALIVTAHRETRFGVGCIVGLGGWGTYGLGRGYMSWACGPLKIQAQMSLQALYDKGFGYAPQIGFRGYLGARSTRYPEVIERTKLFYETRERLYCACSL